MMDLETRKYLDLLAHQRLHHDRCLSSRAARCGDTPSSRSEDGPMSRQGRLRLSWRTSNKSDRASESPSQTS